MYFSLISDCVHIQDTVILYTHIRGVFEYVDSKALLLWTTELFANGSHFEPRKEQRHKQHWLQRQP
jgi:hypothetical protein